MNMCQTQKNRPLRHYFARRPGQQLAPRFVTAACIGALSSAALAGGPAYLPPSSNLVYGDVTHGQRVMSASSNPAAAAVDIVRGGGKSASGTVISGSAGLEYGNVDDLFDKIDTLAQAFKPSDPDGSEPPPGQNPGDKPDDGVDLDTIIDMLDPDVIAAVEELGKEVAIQTALLALITTEGYGKAFLEADAPFVIGRPVFGGAWTFGVNWSGAAKAFGLSDAVDFDIADLEDALEEALGTPNLSNLPVSLQNRVGEVITTIDTLTGQISVAIDNDSSLLTKSVQTTEFNLGYSRQVLPTSAGSLYLGAEARLYLMRLSRLSVRFGDITDSDELFDAIRNNEYNNDEGIGFDIGTLWVADNYQLGAQITNINEPEFKYPRGTLSTYESPTIIATLIDDRTYTAERQLKLEGSVFSANRRWTANLGIDANAAPDPIGDDYQWFTVSAGYTTEKWWLPGIRAGYRKNLAGTELGYVGVGVTALKILNIDIASSLQDVSISGKTLPRGLMASIGFQIAW